MEQLINRIKELKVDNVDACVLYLLAIKHKLDKSRIKITIEDIRKLLSNKLIIRYFQDDGFEEIVNFNFDKVDQVTDFDKFIDTYRSKFKGIKTGVMGDKAAVKAKMIRWLTSNPSFTEDDILNAVEHYLNTTQYLYVMRADYFIYKKPQYMKEEYSMLSTVIEELETNKETQKIDDDEFI